MKRNLLFYFLVFICFDVFSQAKKIPLFEHFTNTYCAPCAAQNPVFESGILNKYPSDVLHIAYHTSWPGVSDVFYQYNIPTNVARTKFYNVTAVPDMILDGNVKSQSPAAYNSNDVITEIAKGSPLEIVVNQTTGVDTNSVQVILNSLGDVDNKDYTLHVVAIEKEVTNTASYGNNGEKRFFNIMRKMLPDQNGTTIKLPAKGSSSTYNFTYFKDAKIYDWSKMEVIAFVQSVTDSFVVNAGSSIKINGKFESPKKITQNVPSSNNGSFVYKLTNTGQKSENFEVKLVSNQPSDWTAKLSLGGVDLKDSSTISVNNGETKDISLTVNAGTTSYVGSYTILVRSLDVLNTPVFDTKSYVISNVEDLIVNNDIPTSSKGYPASWSNIFSDAFKSVGSTKHAQETDKFFRLASQDQSLSGVKNVYFNAGWTFPSLTSDISTYYSNFLNNGGNLFISGQDVAWASFDTSVNAAPYRNVEAQNLIKNYFGLDFIDDGSTTDTKITTVNSDAMYGALGTCTVANFYGGSNLFPDNMKMAANTTAVPLFYYGTTINPNKVAAARNNSNNWKTVYFAPGMEQLSTLKKNNDIMGITYKWFHGLISSTEFDELLNTSVRIYPNPSNDLSNIDLNLAQSTEVSVKISNISGQQITYKNYGNLYGQVLLPIQTSNFEAGMYIVQIKLGDSVISKKLVINK